jgi:hemerythrin
MSEQTTTSSTSTGSTSSTAGDSAVSRRDARHEKLLAGRLAALTLRNQLDSQAAALRVQLAVVQDHKRHAEQLIHRFDEKLAQQHPQVHRVVVEEIVEEIPDEDEAPARRRRR